MSFMRQALSKIAKVERFAPTFDDWTAGEIAHTQRRSMTFFRNPIGYSAGPYTCSVTMQVSGVSVSANGDGHTNNEAFMDALAKLNAVLAVR